MNTKKPVLYLMLGYPGSGKTTTAQAIQELTGAVHMWADHERQKRFPNATHSYTESLQLYLHLNKHVAELLGAGESVIFDTNFNFYKDREKLRNIAKKQGAATVLIWVRTPKELARQRATEQARFPYDYKMPVERFERKAKNLQPPRSNEPYVEVDGTNITTAYIQSLLESVQAQQ